MSCAARASSSTRIKRHAKAASSPMVDFEDEKQGNNCGVFNGDAAGLHPKLKILSCLAGALQVGLAKWNNTLPLVTKVGGRRRIKETLRIVLLIRASSSEKFGLLIQEARCSDIAIYKDYIPKFRT